MKNWKKFTAKETWKEYYGYNDDIVSLWKKGIITIFIKRIGSYQKKLFSKPSIVWRVIATTKNTLYDEDGTVLTTKNVRKDAIIYAKDYMKKH